MSAKKIKLLQFLSTRAGGLTLDQLPDEIRTGLDEEEETDNLIQIMDLLRREKMAQPDGAGAWVITDKGRREIERYQKSLYPVYYKAVLHYLADFTHDFLPVSEVLNRLEVPDEEGVLAAAIEKKLVKEDLVYILTPGGVLINGKGRQRAQQQRLWWQENGGAEAPRSWSFLAASDASQTDPYDDGNEAGASSAWSLTALLRRFSNLFTGLGAAPDPREKENVGVPEA
ncbi:hypothetical protein V9K67_19740 [Paraflavisolibacter sp. H34]|uniref:hypothetical protein n=1 Tax=Huijunlia imazamoxiresistens TaxID=3127457 RepID=UPI003018D183